VFGGGPLSQELATDVVTEAACAAVLGDKVGSDGKFWNVFSAFWAISEFPNFPGIIGTF
jgi:hypothetical protein